ncbi:MAG TPA: FkbM family methyltransferase [Pyrinomonadaceae bacterium]|nr:FkbM family methyltransferase [Pyrinomonadaceae bacterium]
MALPFADHELVSVNCKELGQQIILRRNTSDTLVAFSILQNREYDFKVDREPRLIIDAGANIGLSSLFLSRKFPNARIHAIEPETDNFSLLKLNCEGRENIILHKAALWPHAALLSITDPNADKWAFSFEENNGTGTTPAITIPQIVSLEGCETIDVLKLDIEGAEKFLFSTGVNDWLPLVRTIVIELHDRYVPGCSNAFYSSICNRPFSQEVIGENLIIHFADAQPQAKSLRHHLHA